MQKNLSINKNSNKKIPDIVYEEDAPGDSWGDWENDVNEEMAYLRGYGINIDQEDNYINGEDRPLYGPHLPDLPFDDDEVIEDLDSNDVDTKPIYFDDEEDTPKFGLLSVVSAYNAGIDNYVVGTVTDVVKDKGRYKYTIEPDNGANTFVTSLVSEVSERDYF